MKTNDLSNGGANNSEAAGSGSTPAPHHPARRSFLLRLLNLAAAGLTPVLAVPYIRFLLYPIFLRGSKKLWFSLGAAGQFSSPTAPISRLVPVKMEDGWLESSGQRPVYITKDAQGQVEVLSAVCPHLGCTVQWSSAKNQFLCPCHGSVFTPDGAHISGPSPRGMDSLPVKVENGELMVKYEDFSQLQPVKKVIG
ncbi:MAG TPA: Rieske (2Fe-2S) protein [Terriglobia bacterium]|nr:Rieske (2Fe-2S) protein [Terriglobia bacterium]